MSAMDPMDRRTPRNGHPQAGGLVPAGQVPSKRCHALRKNGEPCKRWALVGSTVCVSHGAAAPQVRDAARDRILRLAPAAIQTLVAALRDDSGAVRVRAAIDLLDRAGLKAAEEHVIVPQEATNAALDAALLAALEARGTVVTRVLDAEAEEPAGP